MSLDRAAELMRRSSHLVAFTGAGISVESGIPAFRGEEGLWSRYDPRSLEIGYFLANPLDAWNVIREIFYDHFKQAEANAAHRALAVLEHRGLLRTLITQNIDNLHQKAGSRDIIEFHGNSQHLLCLDCEKRRPAAESDLQTLPPRCSCGGLLKPDFVFFGEGIPEQASSRAFAEAGRADVFLLIGTTGEVMPANMLPHDARRHGATVIEVNTEPSLYTDRVTNIFLQGKATEVMSSIVSEMGY